VAVAEAVVAVAEAAAAVVAAVDFVPRRATNHLRR